MVWVSTLGGLVYSRCTANLQRKLAIACSCGNKKLGRSLGYSVVSQTDAHHESYRRAGAGLYGRAPCVFSVRLEHVRCGADYGRIARYCGRISVLTRWFTAYLSSTGTWLTLCAAKLLPCPYHTSLARCWPLLEPLTAQRMRFAARG